MNSAIKTLAVLIILTVGLVSFKLIIITENYQVKVISYILFGLTIGYPISDYWLKKFKL